jgi:DNA-binding transcriptional MerR regulator
MSTKSLIELAIEFEKQFIDQKPFSLTDTGVTHKLINYWDGKGLLNNPNDELKWRKFNLEELVWIRMIARLRQLNVNWENIKKIKEELFKEMTVADFLQSPNMKKDLERILVNESDKEVIEQDISKLNINNDQGLKINGFQSLLKRIYLDKINLSIMISLPNDNSNFFKKTESKLEMALYCPESLDDLLKTEGYLDFLNLTFLSISINELIDDSIININPTKLPHNLVIISDEEQVIIKAIRSGNYKTVTIKFDKESKPSMMELSEVQKIKLESRLYEIIHKGAYEDIEIKTQNGEVYHCTHKRKVKL